VQVQSLDQTADNVHVLMDLGAALSDSQILSMLNSGSLTDQIDQDLFSKSVTGVTNGTHVMTVVTREITGNYSIIRATGLGVSGGNGLGFGDTNASGVVDSTDVSQFQTVLQSNDQQFNAGAEANTDGRINLADAFLLGPRLTQVGASNATVAAYNSMINNSATIQNGTYTVDANHTVYDVTAANTHVLGGSTLTARSFRRGNLTIDNGGRVKIQLESAGGLTVRLDALSVGATASLDLNDVDLVVNNGVFSDIQALVFMGYGTTPDTNLTGITSTVGQNTGGVAILALFNNALFGVPDYPFGSGQTIGANAIVGKYTYIGDTDWDGQVTPQDYTAIDANLGATGLDPGLAWFSGDTNFDGNIDPSDYTGIDAALGLGQGNPLAAHSFAAVPEPAGLGLLIGAAALLKRRSRRA
jgi:hypothetical protein